MAADVTVVAGGDVTIAPRMTVENFEKCYMAFVTVEGQQQYTEVASFEEYQARWAAGWRDSLAAFGVETAPAGAVYTANAPPAPEAHVSPETYHQVLGLFASQQAQIDALDVRVTALEAAPEAPTQQPEPEPTPEPTPHARSRRE